jgi:hypothetical protein
MNFTNFNNYLPAKLTIDNSASVLTDYKLQAIICKVQTTNKKPRTARGMYICRIRFGSSWLPNREELVLAERLKA